ncbi:unnamed protein product [Moneuplotes crassus]|uniref:EF-hand domain-containing protein n=1 Tax=Euplotes crassus TaxID=5936 RepID=A0AAD2D7R6_EUPCR|nr:unnamed protein product [Moneuplotes crassus]
MNKVLKGRNHPFAVGEDEHAGFYECDDEGEEENSDYQEYSGDEHVHYPQLSSNKNSLSHYDQQELFENSDRGILQHDLNDQRWVISEPENISGTSEDKSLKYDQRNYRGNEAGAESFENNILNHPRAIKGKYFQNDDFQDVQEKELLTITVEIGNGQQENIVIMQGETADEVAEKFCNKYDMNEELKLLFKEQITQNIDQALNEIDEQEDVEESQTEGFENDYKFHNEKNTQSESAHIEHISTALEPTPPQTMFASRTGMKTQESSSQKVDCHTYSTPGPILINPNRGEKRTLPQQKKSKNRVKANKSFNNANDFTLNQPQINTHSAQLASKKRIPGNSVYTRLHSQAVQKQKRANRIRNAKPVHKSAKKRGRDMFSNPFTERKRTPHNYGEKLYQDGLKRMEERERKSKHEKVQNELKQYESLTFKPKVNSVSKNFRRGSKKLEDQLIEKGKKTNDMIERKRSELLFEQQHSHSFRPKINKKSDHIIQERSRQFLEESSRMAESPHNFSQNFETSYMTSENKLNKFNLLYDDAIKRKQRKDEIYSRCLDSQCTFQPDLTKGNRYDSYYPENHGDFGDRLSKPSTIKEKSRMRHLQDEFYDKESGQPLFRPKVGRPPLSKRDFENLPVTEKLYMEAQHKRHLKEEKIKQNFSKRDTSDSRPKIQDKSEEILEQKKARKFHQIFQILDAESNGVISADKIDISGLPPDILEIFTPLLCEMEELEHILDLEEFIDASMRLYDTLKIPEKNKILMMKDKWSSKKENNDDQCTFHPKLNHNSVKIANRTRPDARNLADMLMGKKLEADAKIDHSRRMKSDEELIGCTFHPQIATSNQYREAYLSMKAPNPPVPPY